MYRIEYCNKSGVIGDEVNAGNGMNKRTEWGMRC